MKDTDQYSPEETEERLRAIMRGAAKARPLPLESIRKKRTPSRPMKARDKTPKPS